jgi:4-amino-4-deoxy-L-arabinose transferase-like glycosyltransferase
MRSTARVILKNQHCLHGDFPNCRNHAIHSRTGLMHVTQKQDLEATAGMSAQKSGATAFDLLLVLAVGLFVNCVYLGSGPLAGTEGHRALVGHQMATGGSWLLPKLYDQVYLAKPPLDYWILASLEKLTGTANERIWRLPSAIAGAMMAVFLCWIGGRWFGRLGGVATGISCCGMVTLWGQNHTAEIDALNTLACVVTSCLFIDLGFFAERRRAAIALAAGLAFGAALLIKGPVGLTGIGAALLGPAIFNRTGRALKQPWPWFAFAIGSGMFGVYVMAALREFRILGLPLETSGVHEVWIHLWNEDDRITYLIPTLLLPVVLLVYAMPVSFFFPMAFYAPLWNAGTIPQEIFSDRQRQLLRAVVGTLVVACVISMLCAFSFPRYSYSWLPLSCLVTGAVVAAWVRGVYPRKITDWLHVALVAAGIGFMGIMIVLVVLCIKEHAGNAAALFGSLALGLILNVLTIRWTLQNRQSWVVGAVIVLLLLTGLLFGMREGADRWRRSAAQFAVIVRSRVPAGDTVTTGHLVLDQPEIFYYSRVNVESHPFSMFIPREFPTSRWMLLEPVEYAYWQKKMPGRLTDVQAMQNRGITAVLAWYEAKGDAASTRAVK